MLMRLKGIKVVTVVKPSGRKYRYYYHRQSGARIKSSPGSAAFAAEIARLDAKALASKPREGSLHALIAAYRSDDTPEWAALKPGTKSDYQRVSTGLHR